MSQSEKLLVEALECASNGFKVSGFSPMSIEQIKEDIKEEKQLMARLDEVNKDIASFNEKIRIRNEKKTKEIMDMIKKGGGSK